MDDRKPPKDASTMTRVLHKGALPIEAALEQTDSEFQQKLTSRLELAFKAALERMMATFDENEVNERLEQAQAVDPEGRTGFSDGQMRATRASVDKLRNVARHRTVVGSALTGSMGFLGQFADIPAFYLYAIRTMADIAISYGFDPRLESEQRFLMEVLRIGHVAGRRQRLVQLDELRQREAEREESLIEETSYALSGRGLTVASQQIAKLLLKRKLGSMIPLIGALVNAGVNWHLMGTILDTADRAFRSKAMSAVKD